MSTGKTKKASTNQPKTSGIAALTQTSKKGDIELTEQELKRAVGGVVNVKLSSGSGDDRPTES